jgi:2'-5' RNA ligase
MPPTLRIFVAVELPTECKKILKDLQDELQTIDTDVKWALPENCHITLKFFGNVEEPKIKSITDIMDDNTRDLASFPITAEHIGAFPSIERPQIIWAGISDGHDLLKNLAGSLESDFAKTGFLPETRHFNAHITIGRLKSHHNARNLISKLTSIKAPSIKIPVQHLTLYQSVLSSQGPAYSAIYRSSLK